MTDSFPDIKIKLPDWIRNFYDERPKYLPDIEERMSYVIELSEINITTGTGGPFGAAVFDLTDSRVISLGTNIVVSTNASMLHAEVVAITIAQQLLGSYNLNIPGKQKYELVTSTEPCAMCFGAIHWSGINQLVCGAREEDARAIGFDEGPKIRNWDKKLQERGITVIRDICRNQAIQVLKQYRDKHGIIYNA